MFKPRLESFPYQGQRDFLSAIANPRIDRIQIVMQRNQPPRKPTVHFSGSYMRDGSAVRPLLWRLSNGESDRQQALSLITATFFTWVDPFPG